MHKIHRSDLIAVAVLSACWLLPLAIIGVSGNFPLNDDWAYTRAVQRLLEIGQIERVAWTWVPAITHAWFGGFFASVLDLPLFEALRVTGWVFGWIGMLGCYALCRGFGVDAAVSGVAAATLAFNPLYLNLSYTFMTDVPFTACMVWSLVAYTHAARKRSWLWIVVGSLLALSAALTRQTGVAVPMTLAIALVLSAPLDWRSFAMAALANGIVFGGYLLGTQVAYGPADAGMFFSAESVQIAVKGSNATYHFVKNTLGQLSYLGCFAAPVVALCAISRRELRTRVWGLAAIFAAAGVGAVAYLRLELPPAINMIFNLGLGRRMLSDVSVTPMVGEWIWWILVGIGFLLTGAATLSCLFAALPRVKEIQKRPDILLCMGLPVAFLAPHLIRAPYFDRYLLPVFSALLVVLLVLPKTSPNRTRARVIASAVSLLVLASFSIVGTRDYLEHHRTRAVLLDGLLARGVGEHQINGGFEFNGMYNLMPKDTPLGPQWSYIGSDEYRLIDWSDFEDKYELVEAASFDRWMPPGVETLRIVRKVPRSRKR